MKIKLRKNYEFIGGHKFKNISFDKTYDVVRKWASSKWVVDDAGRDVVVSGTAFKKYFKEI